MFRKKVLTDTELIPVVTDLIASTQRIHTIDQRLSAIESRLAGSRLVPGGGASGPPASSEPGSLEAERKRADDAERALDRLRNRRSVKVALALAKPSRGAFRTIRSWKKSR